MRDTFVRTLIEEAKKDKSIELLTGDLGFGILKPFWEALPDQFTNVGISEQNMASMAAGMALEGKTVFTYSIGNFPTLRCLEQIRNDCAYPNANVKIVCIGGGLAYGSLGMSHQATEDIAVMRALPNMKVFAPGDLAEAEECTKAIVKCGGTCYMRLGRGGERQIHGKIRNFEIGKAIKVREGKKVAIFSTGAILGEVVEAEKILMGFGIEPAIFSFPTIKPIDTYTIKTVAENYDFIVTVEEHNRIGGFGATVAEVLTELSGRTASQIIIGINDIYCNEVGDQSYLEMLYGLNGKSIAGGILNKIRMLEME